ncbi:MAG TPA: nuclear transport factor 2 family protein [Pyrinomonadaceae bacterium]|nr:nuclear transport factor 2 family protein [Pyrinomonadaceae bacterium]
MSPDVISKAIKTYFAALRAMDVEAWVATFAPDATSYDPVGAPPTVGHDGLRQFLTAITAAFDKVGLTEDHIFIAGNGAAVKWTGRGKGKNGREVRFEGIDIFELNEAGLIQTVRAYWNPAEVMMQLQG